jgi:hypothetical protein
VAANERHYLVGEVANLWKFSPDTIRAIFRERPGVVKLGTAARRDKRGYVSLRIPESVLQQVHDELRRPRDPSGRKK